MTRQVLLLRGVNLGPRNRVPMAELRAALEEAGFEDAKTYLQSGNVVVSSKAKLEQSARKVERLIKEHFGLEIAVVGRTGAQLARIVSRDPLGDVATDPKRYQVSFLGGALPAASRQKLEQVRVESERFVVHGREIYAWHPSGVARSKLWAALAGHGLGVTATARNWTTVTKLLELLEAAD